MEALLWSGMMTQHIRPRVDDKKHSDRDAGDRAREAAPRKSPAIVVSPSTQDRIDRVARALRQASLKVPLFGRL